MRACKFVTLLDELFEDRSRRSHAHDEFPQRLFRMGWQFAIPFVFRSQGMASHGIMAMSRHEVTY